MIEIPAGWGVVVDLDDTLYSEWDFHDSGFRVVAERAGVEDATATSQLMSKVARSGEDALRVLALQTGKDAAELLAWHRGHQPQIRPYQGAIEFLERIVVAGDSFAVVTDGLSVTQRSKLRGLGLLDLTSNIFISEEVGVGKPSPLLFEEAARSLGERPGYVYVADNPAKDFIAPNRMGWMTVMILDQGVNVHPQEGEWPVAQRAHFEARGWLELDRAEWPDA